MASGQARSFVFAIDFRVSQSDRVLPVLEAQRGGIRRSRCAPSNSVINRFSVPAVSWS